LGYILAVPLLVFTATMGLGIISIFIISAIQGQPFAMIPALFIGTIILLATYFSYLFLSEIDLVI